MSVQAHGHRSASCVAAKISAVAFVQQVEMIGTYAS